MDVRKLSMRVPRTGSTSPALEKERRIMDARPARTVANPIRRKLIVDRAGVLEIRADELVPGAIAEVIVFVEAPEARARSLVELIGSGKGLFATAEEADEYIRKEREAWDS
jgi:hypothetical protein